MKITPSLVNRNCIQTESSIVVYYIQLKKILFWKRRDQNIKILRRVNKKKEKHFCTFPCSFVSFFPFFLLIHIGANCILVAAFAHPHDPFYLKGFTVAPFTRASSNQFSSNFNQIFKNIKFFFTAGYRVGAGIQTL